MDLNEILLHSMPNLWDGNYFLQGFGFGVVPLKKEINMFEHMNISASIYEVAVEPYAKTLTRADTNRSGRSNKIRGRDYSSKINPSMVYPGRHKTRYIERLSGDLPPTCMIHVRGHSSECYEIFSNFGKIFGL